MMPRTWILCLLMVLTAGQLPGAEFLPTDGDWHIASNWSTAAIPGASDDVVIPAGRTARTAVTSTTLQARALTVSGILDLSSGSGTQILEVSGTLTVDGTLRLGGTTLDGHLILPGRTPVITGTGSITMGSGSGGSTIYLDEGASASMGGTLSLRGTAFRLTQLDASDGGQSYASAVLTTGSATRVVLSSGYLEIPGGTWLQIGGTLSLGSRAQIRYDGSSWSRFAVLSTGNVEWTMNGNGLAAVLLPGSTRLNGALTVLRSSAYSPARDDIATLVSFSLSAIQGDFPTQSGLSDWAKETPVGSTLAYRFLLERQGLRWESIPTVISLGAADLALPALTDVGGVVTYQITRRNGSPPESSIQDGPVFRPSVLTREDLYLRATAPRFASGATTYDELDITKELSVSDAVSQTVTIDPLPGPYYYGQVIPLVGTCSSGATLVWTSADPAVVISGATAQVVGLSSGVTLQADAPETGPWLAATATVVTGSLLPRPITVVADGGTRPYGAATPAPAFSVDDLAPGDDVDDLGTATFSGTGTTTTATSAVGTYPVSVTLTPANPLYQVTYIAGALTITTLTQAITFPPVADVTAGQTASLLASSDRGLPLTYTSSNTAVATVSGSTVRGVAQGTVTITASQAGNATTDPASSSITLTILPAPLPQTVTIGSLPSTIRYGDVLTLTATGSSGQAATFSTALTGAKLTIVGQEARIIGVGAGASITATIPASTGWLEGTATVTLPTILPRILTATVADAAQLVGDPRPSFLHTLTGFVGTDDASLLGTALYGGDAATATAAGTYALTVFYRPGSALYTLDVVPGTLTISRRSQSLTLPTMTDTAIGQSTALGGSSSSGLALTYISSDPTVATIAAGSVTFADEGTVTITAQQAGDATWLPAPPVSITVSARPRVAPTLTLNLPAGPLIYGDRLTLMATSSSDAAITWTTTDDRLRLTGDVATLVGIGSSMVVSASVPQTGPWLAATATATLPVVMPRPVAVTVVSRSRTTLQPDRPPSFTVSGLAEGDEFTDIGTPIYSGEGTTVTAATPPGGYAILLRFEPADPRYSTTITHGRVVITHPPTIPTQEPLPRGTAGCGLGGGLASCVLLAFWRRRRFP